MRALKHIIWLILWPLRFVLALIFSVIVFCRNTFYNAKWQKTKAICEPRTIVVGNLSTGGTGKTPMVIWLIQELLQEGKKIAVLSRGYGRKTKGFLFVNSDADALHTGDEPLLIKKRYPAVDVAVCENRLTGIAALKEHAAYDIILLDDAFQHRRLKPCVSLLLSSWQKPFTKDYILPLGNLREGRKNAARADIVIITRTDENAESEKGQMTQEIAKYTNAPVLYSSLRYGKLQLVSGERRELKKINLLSGIADPQLLYATLSKEYELVQHFAYSDHHYFSPEQIEGIITSCKGMDALITTEKDWMRLEKKWPKNTELAVYTAPIDFYFDEKSTKELLKAVLGY